MRRLLPLLAAALVGLAATAPPADARRAFSVGLWGDLPYTEEQRTRSVPALIADMNRERLAFSVFDGDIKNGSTRCDDAVYEEAAARFDTLVAPAIYVPGDNEWTDCHRRNNGGFDPLERLTHLRETLASSRLSFGQERLRLKRQADYPENVRWRTRGVVFAGLHVVGSNNNRVADPAVPEPNSDRTPADRTAANAEWAARDAANIAWLAAAFDEAERIGAPAVVLVIQANPLFDVPETFAIDERAEDVEDGFSRFHRALRAEVLAFGKPVLLVHGDSHYFRIDKPMYVPATSDAPRRRVERFTRLETFGELDPHWVELRVDPGSREVFSFEPQIVPGEK